MCKLGTNAVLPTCRRRPSRQANIVGYEAANEAEARGEERGGGGKTPCWTATDAPCPSTSTPWYRQYHRGGRRTLLSQKQKQKHDTASQVQADQPKSRGKINSRYLDLRPSTGVGRRSDPIIRDFLPCRAPKPMRRVFSLNVLSLSFVLRDDDQAVDWLRWSGGHVQSATSSDMDVDMDMDMDIDIDIDIDMILVAGAVGGCAQFLLPSPLLSFCNHHHVS
ncbi:uncharacterized protein IWZ02DRAFT_519228 [Phyllosticta citriasiana]|uniref:uncharacterized protein n=1 Tax=Phyllosticta citriasiana TaxID=595635 RepID=UPI0030FDDF59